MPALVPAPGVLRVVIQGSLLGQPTANVQHWYQTTTPGGTFTQVQADAIALGIRNAWGSTLNLQQSTTTWVLGSVTAQDLGGPFGVMGIAAGSTPGGRSGTALPANCAMCISWRTAMHYRGGHCRTYLAGLVTTDMQNSTSWATASLTSITGAASTYLSQVNATFGGVAGKLALLRRKSANADLHPPAIVDILSPVIDTRIDSMRRRLGKDR